MGAGPPWPPGNAPCGPAWPGTPGTPVDGVGEGDGAALAVNVAASTPPRSAPAPSSPTGTPHLRKRPGEEAGGWSGSDADWTTSAWPSAGTHSSKSLMDTVCVLCLRRTCD